MDLKYYYACCRDGAPPKKYHLTSIKPRTKRQSRKIGDTCISRIYAKHKANGVVLVEYISSHTNHDLSLEQSKFLPLPKDVKSTIAMKLNMGIPVERILDGKQATMCKSL